MQNLIKVKIVTPINILLDQEVSMVTMPGELGEFGVLPDHELLIASLKSGMIKILVNDTILKYFIHSAIVEITGKTVNILTEFAINSSNLPPQEISEKIAILKTELANEIDITKADIVKLIIVRYESLLTYLNLEQ